MLALYAANPGFRPVPLTEFPRDCQEWSVSTGDVTPKQTKRTRKKITLLKSGVKALALSVADPGSILADPGSLHMVPWARPGMIPKHRAGSKSWVQLAVIQKLKVFKIKTEKYINVTQSMCGPKINIALGAITKHVFNKLQCLVISFKNKKHLCSKEICHHFQTKWLLEKNFNIMSNSENK